MDDQHDAIFKALADPSRRRIMTALCKESMVAGDLGRLVSLAPNAVSFHLRLLQEARLVSVKRQGRFLWYEAQRQVIDDWRSFAHGLFGTEPGAIEDHVSRPPGYAPPAGLRQAAPAAAPPHGEHPDAVPLASPPEDSAEEPDDKLPAELL
jgi:DNA-binding transcriptional ArsR family regulator